MLLPVFLEDFICQLRLLLRQLLHLVRKDRLFIRQFCLFVGKAGLLFGKHSLLVRKFFHASGHPGVVDTEGRSGDGDNARSDGCNQDVSFQNPLTMPLPQVIVGIAENRRKKT